MSLKTLKANNYNKVIEALKELGGDDLISKLKKNISIAERKMYHVVVLKVITSKTSLKNKGNIQTIKLHKHAFEKIQKSFIGDKLFILHNPEEDDEEDEIVVPLHEVSKTEAEIRAEVETELENKIQKRVNEALAKQKEEIKLAEFKGLDKIDISGLIDANPTGEAIREFAKAHGLGLKGAKTKDELVEALKSSVEEYNAKIDKANESEESK